MTKLPRIALIGAGAVATALGLRWREQGLPIAAVWSRRPVAAAALAEKVDAQVAADLADLAAHDVIVLAVTDVAIAELALRLQPVLSPHTVLAHVSGATTLAALAPHPSRAVLWPVQTFTKDVQAHWADVPVVVEATTEADALALSLAHDLSDYVVPATAEARLTLHLAATVAANFSNALLAEVTAWLAPLGHDHRLLLPLLHSGLAKLDQLTPSQAQTGPARRGDAGTLAAHRKHLSELDPELLPTYNLLTMRIAQRNV